MNKVDNTPGGVGSIAWLGGCASPPNSKEGIIGLLHRKLRALQDERERLEKLEAEIPDGMSGEVYAMIYSALLGAK